jgi:hypothetical protein
MSNKFIKKNAGRKVNSSQDFDLEMLYVECSRCGRPLIWEKGTTTFIIKSSGIEKSLGSDWVMFSRGCPACSPDNEEFTLTLARPSQEEFIFQNKKLRSN